jgi:hypothetical protein
MIVTSVIDSKMRTGVAKMPRDKKLSIREICGGNQGEKIIVRKAVSNKINL